MEVQIYEVDNEVVELNEIDDKEKFSIDNRFICR